MTPRARIRSAAGLTVLVAAALLPSGTQAAAPIVPASVATKAGVLVGPVAVRARQVQLSVGGRRCTVAAGTPLAALLALRAKVGAAKLGAVRVKDYGGCGTRPSASAQLYVAGIGRDRASGPDGWIYGVNGRRATNGAADPAGPFAKGRLRAGQAVAWRWCAASTDPDGGCGDELTITAISRTGEARGDGQVQLTVAVAVRRSTGAEGTGELIAPPAGTALVLRRADGTTVTGTPSADLRSWSFVVPLATPRTAAWIATAPGIAPAGRLWSAP